ncbi:hypothetical protein [Silvibacterium acidisoli]|uniref:hypothetical protein n=1 Tax=Acidobacteriaceae bacterium ZG23-2 TaxID=2883246 RepID=UPI00406CF165
MRISDSIPMPATPATSDFDRRYKVKPRRMWLLALCCAPLVVAAVYYAPLMVSVGWHIVHGWALEYRGLHVDVPWGWTADMPRPEDESADNPQGVTVMKQPRTLALEARGPETMYFNVLMPDSNLTPAQQAEQWKTLFRESHPTSRFVVTSVEDKPGGGDCLEAKPLDDRRAGSAIACISLDQHWLASYAGAVVHTPLFFHAIEQLANSNGRR